MNITSAAYRKLIDLKPVDEDLLRISILAGGCSGYSYHMEFTNQTNFADKYITVDDLSIIIDPKSYLFLQDVEIDFEDGLNGQGFIYNNPNSKRNCGCGTSFSV